MNACKMPVAALHKCPFKTTGFSHLAIIKLHVTTQQRGFTLIELLVVVLIIGLLAGFVAPRYFAQIGRSEVNVAKAQIDALEKALDQYRLDTGRYPSTELGLNALMERPANEPSWAGPYLRKAVPLDPWGRPYIYRMPGERGDYELVSHGKDGKPGGTGDAADISNDVVSHALRAQSDRAGR